MNCSLRSLKGDYIRDCMGSIIGVIKRILGVQTIAHIEG